MPDEETAPPRAVPLAEVHRSLGAEVEPAGIGIDVPSDYGSPREEYGSLHRSCGLSDRSWVPQLEMTGEDRVRFLNGLVTCDVSAPEVGEGTYGFFTDPKGRVLADVAVLTFEDRLLLELPPGRAPAIAEHMAKYRITDRVEMSEVEDRWSFAVTGPMSRQLLEGLAGRALSETDWHHEVVEIHGREVELTRHPRLGSVGYVMRGRAAEGEDLFRELTDRSQGDSLPPVGHTAMEGLRVEAGIPIWNLDLDAAALPQETGFTEAVSYTKGCYLGQEIVARIHYRGGVNRHLRGLKFEVGQTPVEGAKVLLENSQVGVATSPMRSPRLGQPIALSLVHRKAAEPGTRVEVEGVGIAEVTELPFVREGIA